MHKRTRYKQTILFQFPASLILILSTIVAIEQMQPAIAHPYQVKSLAEYEQEQSHWREMIKRDPQNPEAYLQLGASLRSEASEGYWCNTAAIAIYREGVAAIPSHAQLHFQLGMLLVEAPALRCDDQAPSVIASNHQEGILHLQKAIAIAAENASAETLVKTADLLIQANQLNPTNSR